MDKKEIVTLGQYDSDEFEKALESYIGNGNNYFCNSLQKANVNDLKQLVRDSFFEGAVYMGNANKKFKATPITPESLKAIGFKMADDNVYGESVYIFNINESEIIYCNGNMWIQTCETDPNLYFAYTEQIKEWIKPFTKEEENG